MCNNRVRNVGQFPDLMARDVRDGRLRPQVWAAEVGMDPSWVHRIIKGDAPLPASLLGALVQHTGNPAYLCQIADECDYQVSRSAARQGGDASLQGLSLALVCMAPDVLKHVRRWLGGSTHEAVPRLERIRAALIKINEKVDTALADVERRIEKSKSKDERSE